MLVLQWLMVAVVGAVIGTMARLHLQWRSHAF